MEFNEPRASSSGESAPNLEEYLQIAEKKIKELEEEIKRLKEIAYIDQLTGLSTRRSLQEKYNLIFKPKYNLEFEDRRGGHAEDNVGLLMIDIDNFKKINDEYGHLAGDQVLAEVSKRLKSSIRSTDVIARYGGEEIQILLLGASDFETRTKANRLRKLIEEEPIAFGESNIAVTVSVGLTIGDKSSDPSVLTREADLALYKAKESGRNLTLQFTPDMH